MHRPKSPCNGCRIRQARCHCDCSRYADFRQDNETYRQLIAERNKKDDKIKYCSSRISRMYR